MDRKDKGFKLSVLNQFLIIAIFLMILFSMYVMVKDIANAYEKDFDYSVIGCRVETSKNNVSANFTFEGNYTILIEYQNISKNNQVENKYFIQYKLNEITTNSTYMFDITRDYDEIYFVIRNDDRNFSEAHRIS